MRRANGRMLKPLRTLASCRPRLARFSSSYAASRLVEQYRTSGHLMARLAPVMDSSVRFDHVRAEFNIDRFFPSGDAPIDTAQLPRAVAAQLGADTATAAELASAMQQLYCGTMSAEFSHLASQEERDFWASAIEESHPAWRKAGLGKPAARHAFRQMAQAEEFERFLGVKLPSLKRYSGEGAESMHPLLSTALDSLGATSGAAQAVVGMPHRGRLAFLAGVMQYPIHKLFHKLLGSPDIPDDVPGLDDVSSHVAHSRPPMPAGPLGPALAPLFPAGGSGGAGIGVSLLHNPSHLEAVNPVAMGKTRAKRVSGEDPRAACVLVHGDGAFSGQGVVGEALAMAALPGFAVGGTVHVVVNNLLAFTAGAQEGRSTAHATDVAKGYGVPVVHVNAEDVDGVIFAARCAVEYRRRFGNDVVVNLVGFRRHGHNEVDEPRFTNPKLYSGIDEQASFPERYGARLAEEGVLSLEEQERIRGRARGHLEQQFQAAKELPPGEGAFSLRVPGMKHAADPGGVVADGSAYAGKWKGMRPASPADVAAPADTGVPGADLLRYLRASVDVEGAGAGGGGGGELAVHDRLLRTFVKARQKMGDAAEGDPGAPVVDWASAEAMAFGAALADGSRVRLCGQDAQRGTFSHRHAAMVCQNSERRIVPLNAVAGAPTVLDKADAPPAVGLEVVSSHLSEFAVMGFEYGHSLEAPDQLCLWEAQFGDFMNGAQIAIDAFVASGESKWLRSSGLVLLLPHGYDGAGPEHSSCRVERFLQMVNSQALAGGGDSPCLQGALGDDALPGDKSIGEAVNMRVAAPTTPANYFHLLRRQTAGPFRKPLVVVGPKTLLRHKACLSPLNGMQEGTAFRPVLVSCGGALRAPGAAGGEEAAAVRRVIVCSGKIAVELEARRRELAEADAGSDAAHTAVVRIEELAPWPEEKLGRALGELAQGERLRSVRYVQEEPANAGAWQWAKAHCESAVEEATGCRLEYVGRPAMAAPAAGVSHLHKAQVQRLFHFAFAE